MVIAREVSHTFLKKSFCSQYLIYIENYVNEERDDCRTYSPGEKMNVTDITTCGENDKDYPRDLPVCPNADR